MFELSRELLQTIPILSDSEIFFLKKILPLILIIPWILYFLYLLLRWIAKLLQSKEQSIEYKPDLGWLQDTKEPAEVPLPLRQIEKMAETDPRKAIWELSRHIRLRFLPQYFRPYSLEYFVKRKEKSLASTAGKWYNLFFGKIRSLFQHKYSPFFSDLVGVYYSGEEITTKRAIEFIEKAKEMKVGENDGV